LSEGEFTFALVRLPGKARGARNAIKQGSLTLASALHDNLDWGDSLGREVKPHPTTQACPIVAVTRGVHFLTAGARGDGRATFDYIGVFHFVLQPIPDGGGVG
jgi:hypothetical protein